MSPLFLPKLKEELGIGGGLSQLPRPKIILLKIQIDNSLISIKNLLENKARRKKMYQSVIPLFQILRKLNQNQRLLSYHTISLNFSKYSQLVTMNL